MQDEIKKKTTVKKRTELLGKRKYEKSTEQCPEKDAYG